MFVARSFDINRPGTELKEMAGGVLGGALKQGIFKVNQEIEIKPGISLEKDGKRMQKPIKTKIAALKTGEAEQEEVHPGGSIGVQTTLDPYYVKADSLTGNMVGLPGQLPPVWEEFAIKPTLLERVVGAKEEVKVDPIKKFESLMLNVNAAATVGVVTDIKKSLAYIKLKIPVCCAKEDRITISRMMGNRWRLIGFGTISEEKK
jgi:translation initiation factor 2 subunit 3